MVLHRILTSACLLLASAGIASAQPANSPDLPASVPSTRTDRPAPVPSALTDLPASVPSARPNIIFILADDLGYGDLGCYGQQKINTPNIDALAAHGLRFTQFYAGTAVCAPSRASFMTGLHTGHTPVRGNRGFKPEGQFPLPDSTRTIARVLQENGYLTADFGKWGLGYPGSSGVPQKQGFDIFYGYNCQSLAHNYYPDHLWQNDQRIELAANKTGDSIYSADLIHQQAMKFLHRTKDKPFFLWLSYTLPHAALSVPHDAVYDYYVKKFNEPARDERKTKKFEKAAFEPYPHAAYAAMVARLDKYVGEIVHEVDRQGIAGNTLILFSSDNGPHQEGGNEPEFFDSNGFLRGIKRDVYEGGIRIPFIAAWKGKIKPGGTSNFTGAFWDLFPTFQQVAGIPVTPTASSSPSTASSSPSTASSSPSTTSSSPSTSSANPSSAVTSPSTGAHIPHPIDGLSFLPTLLGNTRGQRQHDYLYWEFHENGGRQAVRWGKWKGVRLNVNKQNNVPIELYDLDKDPSEKNNIAAGHPEIVKKMATILQYAHTPDKNWPLLPGEESPQE